jgi:hypothetical protein
MDFHGVSPHVVDVCVGLSDESEAIGALLHQYIGVGPKRKLQDPAEDVGQAPELLGAQTQKRLSLRERVS